MLDKIYFRSCLLGNAAVLPVVVQSICLSNGRQSKSMSSTIISMSLSLGALSWGFGFRDKFPSGYFYRGKKNKIRTTL